MAATVLDVADDATTPLTHPTQPTHPKQPTGTARDTPSTADLVAAASTGDATAWTTLVERHAGLVWSIARGYRLGAADAADVSQTVWLRLVENLDRVRDPERLAGWLVTTARRESLRLVKGARREVVDDEAVERVPTDPESSLESIVLSTESGRELWAALTRLSDRCQRLLRAFAYHPDLSYADVSAALGIPVGSLGPTRGRCLDQLRDALAAADDRGTS